MEQYQNWMEKLGESDQNSNSLIKVANSDIEMSSNLGGMKMGDGMKFQSKKDFTTFEVTAVIPSTNPTLAAIYPIFYVATVQCFLLEAKLRHDVNSTSGFIDVEKIIDGVAKGSGTSMLVSKFDTSSGARTTIRKTVTITAAGYQLAPGDAVALKASGTLTNLSDVCVTLLFGVLNRHLPVSANL